MKALTIASNAVTLLLRDRSNIFFVFMLPMMLILVLGAAFGGGMDPRVGIHSAGNGPLGSELVERIMALEGMEVTEWEDPDALVRSVERGGTEAAILVPDSYDEDLAAGERATVEYVSGQDASAMALRNAIESAIIEQGALLRAASLAVSRTDVAYDDAIATARSASEDVARIEIATDVVGELNPFQRLGQFELGAYSQLLLFVFLTSMTGSTALIEARRLGVTARMLATPTPVRSILAGEALGRLAVALVQGLFIMIGTSLVFGVSWGDPVGAAAVLLIFSAGAAGTAMLMGSVLDNPEQAGGIGVVLGIGLGAIGGSMVPLTIMEMFSETLYRVAHVTPHAWGIRAFEELIMHDGTVADILPELAVLSAFAVTVYALGAWRLRVKLTRP